jgi:hypothetical protein
MDHEVRLLSGARLPGIGAIELDASSHRAVKRQERDEFMDAGPGGGLHPGPEGACPTLVFGRRSAGAGAGGVWGPEVKMRLGEDFLRTPRTRGKRDSGEP